MKNRIRILARASLPRAAARSQERIKQADKEVAAERYGPETEPVFLNSGQGLLFGSAEDFARRK